jgi:N-acyl-L-homoserine lactone synthetase
MHLVTSENRANYAPELREMHAQRKQIFLDELAWPLVCQGELEFDEFDTDASMYLLHFGAKGELAGSARLLRTDRPHLLDTAFAHLCKEELPRGDTIWEATRFCPSPKLKDRTQRHALLGVIIAGILEAGLLFGTTEVTFVASGALKPLALSAGWNARTLGPSQRYKGDRVTACVAAVDSAGLRQVRARFGLHAPLLRYLPVQKAA